MATTVWSELLSVLPPVSVQPMLLRAMDLVPAQAPVEVPAWITDEALKASIVAGFVDLPDWGTP